jgi:hypothetical protein
MCRPSDVAAPAGSITRWRNIFMPGGADPSNVVSYWHDVSNGRYDAGGSATFGWLDIGHTTTEINRLTGQGQRVQLANWGRAAAASAGIDLSRFRQVVIGYNINADHGSVGGNTALIAYAEGRALEPTFIQHEFGHALGLRDSASTEGGIYGNSFDIMSAMLVRAFSDTAGRGAGPGASAVTLENLGWLPASRVVAVRAPFRPLLTTQITLAALNRPDLADPLAVKVDGAPTIYIEYREPTGWDRGLSGPVVLVHRRSTTGNTYDSAEIFGNGWTPVGALSPGDTFNVPHLRTSPPVTVKFVRANTATSQAKIQVLTGS